MSPNPITSLIAGCVLLGIGGGALWGIFFGLEAAYKIMGESMQYLIAAPLILFVAYLVGHGYLELKSAGKLRH